MATKKAGGSTRNGRDSEAKRLGVKLFEGQTAKSGSIIIRQRGTKYFPGTNVQMGRDHTLFSIVEGLVSFTEKRMVKFNGRVYRDKLVHVTPAVAVAAAPVAKKRVVKAKKAE